MRLIWKWSSSRGNNRATRHWAGRWGTWGREGHVRNRCAAARPSFVYSSYQSTPSDSSLSATNKAGPLNNLLNTSRVLIDKTKVVKTWRYNVINSHYHRFDVARSSSKMNRMGIWIWTQEFIKAFFTIATLVTNLETQNSFNHSKYCNSCSSNISYYCNVETIVD